MNYCFGNAFRPAGARSRPQINALPFFRDPPQPLSPEVGGEALRTHPTGRPPPPVASLFYGKRAVRARTSWNHEEIRRAEASSLPTSRDSRDFTVASEELIFTAPRLCSWVVETYSSGVRGSIVQPMAVRLVIGRSIRKGLSVTDCQRSGKRFRYWKLYFIMARSRSCEQVNVQL